MFQQISAHRILQMHQQRLTVCLDPAALPLPRPLRWESLSMRNHQLVGPRPQDRGASRNGKKDVLQLEIVQTTCLSFSKGKLNKNKLASNLVQVSSLVLPLLVFAFPG